MRNRCGTGAAGVAPVTVPQLNTAIRSTRQKGNTVSDVTVEALTALSDTLLSQRQGALENYLMWRVRHNKTGSETHKELADYYLGIWKGLGMALESVDAEQQHALYAMYCDQATEQVAV